MLPRHRLLIWTDNRYLISKLFLQIPYINVILHIKKVSVRDAKIAGKTQGGIS